MYGYNHVSERVAHVGYKYPGSRLRLEFEITCVQCVITRGVEMCVRRGECANPTWRKYIPILRALRSTL